MVVFLKTIKEALGKYKGCYSHDGEQIGAIAYNSEERRNKNESINNFYPKLGGKWDPPNLVNENGLVKRDHGSISFQVVNPSPGVK